MHVFMNSNSCFGVQIFVVVVLIIGAFSGVPMLTIYYHDVACLGRYRFVLSALHVHCVHVCQEVCIHNGFGNNCK